MNIHDPHTRPGNYFVRWYIPDPDAEDGGPDEEVVEELCNEGETIDEREAIARAGTLVEPKNAYCSAARSS